MKRWMLAVTIGLVVAVSLAGLYFWIHATSNTTKGNECTALECGGALLAFGRPLESNRSGYHLYNFSLQSAGGGVVWGDLGFDVQPSGGVAFQPSGTGWNVTVFGLHGDGIAFWEVNASGGVWTAGGNLTLLTQEYVLLTSPPASNLSGDSFDVIGQAGGFGGLVTIAIP